MAKGIVYNQNGEKEKEIDLPQDIFGVPFNADLVHQAVVAQSLSARKPVAHTKTREEVRGGGRKPWKQKGTGRARHGSIRSPLWKGGGTTFGPRSDKDYSQKINKKMKRKALCMVLGAKNSENNLALVDAVRLSAVKTKETHALFTAFVKKVFGATIGPNTKAKRLLVIEPKKDVPLERTTRNIPWVHVIGADSLNVVDCMAYRYVAIIEPALEVIQKTFTKK